MRREFSYLRRGKHTFPLIDVELIGPKESLMAKALLDSGATYSLFRPEIATYLGVPLKHGQTLHFQGIKGSALGYLHRIPVKVGPERFVCFIAFSPEVKASFNILGRNFFLPFLITFNEKLQKVLLEQDLRGTKR